ncbi:LysE family transporter [Brevibacillus sp. GCM10020057]|uniref:LysE family transporter n=1 Tax=Brevibacillus sp. GCM10020057 TaxID=3317327 RepID=UPI00363A53A5
MKKETKTFRIHFKKPNGCASSGFRLLNSRAGIMADLGAATGDLIYTMLAAVGLRAILMKPMPIFRVVKWKSIN